MKLSNTSLGGGTIFQDLYKQQLDWLLHSPIYGSNNMVQYRQHCHNIVCINGAAETPGYSKEKLIINYIIYILGLVKYERKCNLRIRPYRLLLILDFGIGGVILLCLGMC